MSKIKSKVSLFIDLGLGLVFGYSALVHLSNPFLFLESVLNYGILNQDISFYASSYLPHLQFCIAICLIFGFLKSPARIVAIGLLGAFVLAQIFVLLNDRSVPCGCFGDPTEKVGVVSLARTLILALVTAAVIYCDRGVVEIDHPNPNELAAQS